MQDVKSNKRQTQLAADLATRAMCEQLDAVLPAVFDRMESKVDELLANEDFFTGLNRDEIVRLVASEADKHAYMVTRDGMEERYGDDLDDVVRDHSCDCERC